MPPPAKDAIVNSGKKMASDFREGLWTFFEDIRQATVGEEGINGMETRTIGSGRLDRQGSKGTPESGQPGNKADFGEEIKGERQKEMMPSIDRTTETPPPHQKKDNSFWNEFGLETPSNKETDTIEADRLRKPGADAPLVDIDDSWDVWESPGMPPHSPKHGATVDEKPPSGSDGLPWPELTKLTPSRLSRTVSDLMKDWKSTAVAPGTNPAGLAGLDDPAVVSPHI